MGKGQRLYSDLPETPTFRQTLSKNKTAEFVFVEGETLFVHNPDLVLHTQRGETSLSIRKQQRLGKYLSCVWSVMTHVSPADKVNTEMHAFANDLNT